MISPDLAPPTLFEELHLPAPVALSFEHKPQIPCSRWSEEHIVIPKVKNAVPGPWRNEVTPYLAEPMDKAAAPWVREIVFCSGSQLGKTQWTHNFLGYCADRHPAPALVVMSDETMATRIVAQKLRPLWLESPVLTGLTRGITDALKLNEFQLANGMVVHLAWASSEAKLASLPYAILILDEVEKYGDPSARYNARARLRWFPHTSKLIETSTPKVSNGPIWVDLMACDEVRCYFAVCPQCGHEQRLVFDRIKWPTDERDPKRVLHKKLARYECESCEGRWTDLERDLAVRMGRWRPVHRDILSSNRQLRAEAEERTRAEGLPEPLARPRSIGYQISSLYSHFVSLSAIAAKFLAALKSQHPRVALQDLYNNELGEPYDEVAKIENPEAEALLRFRDPELPPHTVPEWADFAVAFFDMQQVGFWFSVWAFERRLYPMRKALVHYGRVASWQELQELVENARYPVRGETGTEVETLGIWRAWVDTGGSKEEGAQWSRTAEAYLWLRANGRGRIFGAKGLPRRAETQPKVRLSVQDKPPARRPGAAKGAAQARKGLAIWLIDANRFKDDLAAELASKLLCAGCAAEADRWAVVERGGLCPACGGEMPGWQQTIILHAGTGTDWARQILAEEKHMQKDGSYEWSRVHKDNHYLDCAVGCLAIVSPEAGGGALKAPRRDRAGGEMQSAAQSQPGGQAADPRRSRFRFRTG